MTLGIGTILGGITLWISDATTISGISIQPGQAGHPDETLGIPLEFYYGLAVRASSWYLFEYTAVGTAVLIVGRGRNVARLSGLRVQRLRIGALVASGVGGALAGMLYTGTSGSADPTSGANLLLPAFAAAFLGATAIMPGRFNRLGLDHRGLLSGHGDRRFADSRSRQFRAGSVLRRRARHRGVPIATRSQTPGANGRSTEYHCPASGESASRGRRTKCVAHSDR